MAPLSARRRRKVAGGILRAGVVLSVVLVTAFVLHHPVNLVLRPFAGLADGRSGTGSAGGGAVGAGSAEGRSLTEERLLQDSFLSANASIVDEIAALGHALLHPPKEPGAAAGGSRAGCLPDHWTGNPGDYNLTRAAIACMADADGVVMVTWANWHYQDFVRNWVHHVRAANISSFLVGAMDDQLLEALAANGVAAFSMNSGLTTGDFGWGSQPFHKMGREKIGLINTFTQMNFSILVSDVDTVWMRNPLPFMAAHPQAAVLTSSDHLMASAADGGLEWPDEAVHSPANIGIMLVRATANAFAKEWLTVILKDDKYWDQNAFNDLMRRGAAFTQRRDDSRLFLGYDRKFLFGILPVATFCSGHTFFVQRMPQKLGLDPYVAHATFQYSGTPGKRHRFREALLWNDPPEYFEKRYLAYKPDIPSELLRAATPPDQDDPPLNMTHLAPQFDLIHHQLKQLRNAWAIAQVLNRTLVLPEFWSAQDRYWAPHNGRMPGSALDLPFLAPADHILELEAAMMHPKPEAEFGPHMDFREHSFLRNPRMPAAVRRSRAHIAVCQPDVDQRLCADGSGPAPELGGRVRLRRHLNDRQLVAALQNYEHSSIMIFDSMLDTFDGFEDVDATRRFHNRLRDVAGLFCCISEQPHGHVYYDMWHDVVPHTDQFGREFKERWHPILGP